MQLSEQQFCADWVARMGELTPLTTATVLQYLNLRAQADARPVVWSEHDIDVFATTFGADPKELVRAVLRQVAATHPEASGPGLSDAIAWVIKRRDDYIEEFGHVDPDTGALEYGTGKHAEAKREYVGELDEIIEGLQSLTRASAATVAEPSDMSTSEKNRLIEQIVNSEPECPICCTSPVSVPCKECGYEGEKQAAQQQAEPGADERAEFWQDNDNGLMSRVPESITQATNDSDVPDGYAGAMPYSDDWTMVVFEADKVPEGTPIYLRAAQSGQRAGVAEGFTDSDVYTLIGHAEYLKGIGQTDMPVWMYGMAERVATAIADPGLADRCRQLAAPTQQQEGGS